MYNRYSLGFHNPMKGGYFIMLQEVCTQTVQSI